MSCQYGEIAIAMPGFLIFRAKSRSPGEGGFEEEIIDSHSIPDCGGQHRNGADGDGGSGLHFGREMLSRLFSSCSSGR